MSMIVSSLAEALYNLNPSLCKIPPRYDHEEEYCFMGPDGGTDGAIRCKELPYSMRGCVGSWMLHPERHIIEGFGSTVVATIVILWLLPKLRRSQDQTLNHQYNIQHPTWAPLVSLFCFSTILFYKCFGYPNRIFFFVMPCNMQWLLSFIQCYCIPKSWNFVQYTLLQVRLTYIMSVVIAIFTPETDDCTMFGEYAFYWINHFLLLFLPAAYIANGSVSCFPPSPDKSVFSFNFEWWLFSCACMQLFYFIPVTVMSVYSGLNLNFMLHPPADHFLLKGPWFRLMAVASLAFFFVFSRLLCIAFEKSVNNKSKAATTKKQL
jgi:hypothetical protein